MKAKPPKVVAVIPCFRAKNTILEVLAGVGPEVSNIVLVDDGCPDRTGEFLQRNSKDKRLRILFHEANLGVGAAMVTGYKEALKLGADIVVKIDADGQMDPSKIGDLIEPILLGHADYTKGDRLDSLTGLRQMPSLRLFGNTGLTLLTKFSTGYWNIKDPTNGFTAIQAQVLRKLPLSMLNKGYFFESDMLFRLNIFRAVVVDVPMEARYGGEESSLNELKALFQFPWLHFINFHKRVFYNYYLRDVSAASVELLAGLALWWLGIIYGVATYFESSSTGLPATTGNVMIAVLPIILGFQLLLAFLSFDVSSVPKKVKHRRVGE